MSCAICGATEQLEAITVAPREDEVQLCATCRDGLTSDLQDVPHWRCLNDAIWSTEPAVQVLAWRFLNRLPAAWARDLLDIAYLEPEVLTWAAARAGDRCLTLSIVTATARFWRLVIRWC